MVSFGGNESLHKPRLTNRERVWARAEKIPPFSASRKEREENKGCPRMGVLEQITQMKNQGINDDEIVASLQQQGISPQQITEALDQSQVKSAVSAETQEIQGMQPSIMTQEATQAPSAPGQQTQQTPQQETYPPQQEYQSQEYYPQEGYQDYSAGIDTTTIMEIAEQVFVEKIQKTQKQLEELNEFKTLSQVKIQNIDERLKKIEATIDKLQFSILDKIGSYGANLGTIKKEIAMIESSFGKTKKPTLKKLIQKPILKKKISKKR